MLRAAVECVGRERVELGGRAKDALRVRALGQPLLSEQVERDLVARAQAGDRAALDALLAAHMRLVYSVARSYAKHGVPMEDLVAEGMLALCEAARRFDPSRGFRFATCGRCWLKAHLRRYTLHNRRIVSAPSTRNARTVIAHLRRTERRLAQETGAPPCVEQVASALSVKPSDITMVASALSGGDVEYDDGARVPWVSPDPSPEEMVADAEVRADFETCLAEALDSLTPREREIVLQRTGNDVATLESLGATLGVSRERVRQIEERAKRKLRSALQHRLPE